MDYRNIRRCKECVPTLQDLVHIYHKTYDETVFLQIEQHVLATIQWTCGHPTARATLLLLQVVLRRIAKGPELYMFSDGDHAISSRLHQLSPVCHRSGCSYLGVVHTPATLPRVRRVGAGHADCGAVGQASRNSWGPLGDTHQEVLVPLLFEGIDNNRAVVAQGQLLCPLSAGVPCASDTHVLPPIPCRR